MHVGNLMGRAAWWRVPSSSQRQGNQGGNESRLGYINNIFAGISPPPDARGALPGGSAEEANEKVEGHLAPSKGQQREGQESETCCEREIHGHYNEKGAESDHR